MSTNPITQSSAADTLQTSTQTNPQGSTSNVADALTSTDTFLTLLVAQLKNQDPLNPADGTQFVTQLATFSGVEQSTQMRDDLDAIRAAVTAQNVAPGAAESRTTKTTTTN